MQPHHKAWLQAHPERSRAWFKTMIAEGFQVHHVDGDHSNDHPDNLVLIESVDHMRLHGLFRLVTFDRKKMAAKAAQTRMQSMTPKQRSKLAQHAANRRWIRHRKELRAGREANT